MAIKYPVRKRVYKPGSSKPPIVNRGTGHPTSMLGATGHTTPQHGMGGGHINRLRGGR